MSTRGVTAADFIQAFEHAPLGVMITEGDRIIHANHAALEILGYAFDELLGKTVADLTHTEDRETSYENMERLRHGRIECFAMEKRYAHKSGRTVWGRVRVALIGQAQGAHRYIVHIEDITREVEAEAVLRESEERLRQMADNIDQDFWMMQIEPLQMLYTGPAATRIWGFDPAQFREQPERIAEHVHPEDLPIFGELFGSMLAGAREREYRIVRRDGEIRWLHSRVFPVRDRDGNVYRVAGVTEDVTDRKTAELELIARAEFEQLITKLSREFVNCTAERIADHVLLALRELAEFVTADRAAIYIVERTAATISMAYGWRADHAPPTSEDLRLHPFSPDDAVFGSLWAEGAVRVVRPEQLPPERDALRRGLESSGIGSFIGVPLLKSKEPIGVLGFASSEREHAWPKNLDKLLTIAAEMIVTVLDRQAVEEELSELSRLKSLIVSLATDFINLPAPEVDAGIERALADLGRFGDVDRVGIFQVSDDGARICLTHEWHNEGMAPGDDYRREWPVDESGPEIERLFDGEIINVPSVAALPAGSDFREINEYYRIRSLLNVPLISSQKVFGWLGIGTVRREATWSDELVGLLRVAAEMFANAIERVRIEDAARRHRADLAHVLRLGTIGQLAAGLAHELNQPLSAIVSYASGCERLIDSGGVDIAKLRGALVNIRGQAVRAAAVIKTLRTLVRKGDPRRRWHEINTLIGDALRFVEPEVLEAAMRMTFDAGTDLPRVQVDAAQIEQVVINLVRNAIDAVLARTDGAPREIRIATTCPQPGRIEVRVSDTGIGIPRERIDAIFDDFDTTKPEGLGLGLSISRSLVEAHGGRLWAESSPRGGATFRFYVPASSV